MVWGERRKRASGTAAVRRAAVGDAARRIARLTRLAAGVLGLDSFLVLLLAGLLALALGLLHLLLDPLAVLLVLFLTGVPVLRVFVALGAALLVVVVFLVAARLAAGVLGLDA